MMRSKKQRCKRQRLTDFFSVSCFFASLFLCLSASHPAYSNDAAKTLYEKGLKLEGLQDQLTEKAEKACYWGKSGDAGCMEKFVRQYNGQYGAGSFEYAAQMNYIRYTGIHFRELLQKYPESSYAAAADFKQLNQNLTGQPSEVFQRVQNFLNAHSQTEWQCQGKLLLARLNQDVWALQKSGRAISSSGNAETYRAAALKLFDDAVQLCKEAPKKAATSEAALLKAGKDDGKFYGIVNESMSEGDLQ